MADWQALFPETYRTFTSVGEVSGTLDEAMLYLAEILEEEVQLMRQQSPLSFLYASRVENWQELRHRSKA